MSDEQGASGEGRPAQPPSGSAPRQDSRSTASIVLGLMSIPLSLFCGLLAMIPAMVAIVLGVQGRRRARAEGAPTGVAVAGIVLGVVGFLIPPAYWIVALSLSNTGG